HRHQRRVQCRRDAPHDVIADKNRQYENDQIEDDGIDGGCHCELLEILPRDCSRGNLLNSSHAGATGRLPGMMARSEAKPINSTALLASRATKPAPRQAPSLRVDARMRRLLRAPPRLVV